ncbi:hypothetical protein TH53_12260 [Pedobacter lusitanus]|uniref:FecR family protein n=1 Tax=Pedobacter lusitanus TaxID=1503925 RepID=A0A0D0GI13_9SPHI|nr:FecR domain-containing protein [Pedobacter lusitanus]KIO76872.1 hypothetical protein TH53_12260 [Pedobacter lusitanus]
MMDEIKDLLDRYISNTCSVVEKEHIENWLDTYVNENNEWQTIDDAQKKYYLDSLLSTIHTIIDQPQKKHYFKLNLSRVLAIASAVILVLFSVFFCYQRYQYRQAAVSLIKNDVKGGGNKARLTLANGKQILLADASDGAIANESGIKITKKEDGQLTYEISEPSKTAFEQSLYNKIETPNGGQYQLNLPDGTKVWLNAATTLKYNVNMASAKERKVELSGEAYFEVAKDKIHPFIVQSARQEIKVLGTHFNVDSYPDQHMIKTTLLEGSVLVHQSGFTDLLLKPDQQSINSAKGLQIISANIKETMAWKNGYFIFNGEKLEDIMKKISRWYDVQVIFEDDLQLMPFTGVISRSKNLSSILQLLQETGNVHFKKEGGSVIIMK